MDKILNNTEGVDDWKYLELCIEYSKISTDLSTKNCAIIVPTDDSLFITGVNSPPASLYTEERLQRPLKHIYTTHAERKAIYSCARRGARTEGSCMYVLWAACTGCAQAIIESGINRIITLDTTVYNDSNNWADEVRLGLEMLNEANIKIDRIKPPKEILVFVKGGWKKCLK